MSEYTVVRIDVDADIVRRAARAVPGIEVPVEFDPDTKRVTPFPGETDATADDADAPADTDDTGQSGRIRALIREYGLLAAGVAMVGAGVATAGLWWYRRRNRDDGSATDEAFERSDWAEPDSAAVTAADRLGGSEPVPNPDGVPAEQSDDDPTSTELGTSTAGTVADEDDRTEADRAESPTRAPAAEPASDTAADAPTEQQGTGQAIDTEDETPDGPALGGENGGLDRAPLLGVGFLALSGAVVRWLQRES